MPNLVPAILPLLEEHRLPGLDAGARVIYPHYQGYSLANLPSSVCGWLGAPAFRSAPAGGNHPEQSGRPVPERDPPAGGRPGLEAVPAPLAA